MAGIREILLGVSPQKIALVLKRASIERDEGVEVDRKAAIWKTFAALQALPEILIAANAHGGRLMEVVLNGDLIQAADGSGFRAFAMGDDGILAQAKLFDPGHLTSLMNGAVLWRLASIAVAQKHLADISWALSNIEKGVSAIAVVQRSAQASKIEAAFGYLKQASAALADGDRNQAVRMKLEHVEAVMDAIQRTIEKLFEHCLRGSIKDPDLFGYDKLVSGFDGKLGELEGLLKEHRLAYLTRIAALRVLAAYPGERAIKAARASAIRDSLIRYEAMGLGIGGELSEQPGRWTGQAEAIRGTVIEYGKDAVNLINRALGKNVISVGGSSPGVTPYLDAVKAASRTKALELASRERGIAERLEKACTTTDRIVMAAGTPDRYLVEWGHGQPLSIRSLRA